MKPVESSNIQAVAYDAAERILKVSFKSGKTYHYLGCAPETHAAFLAAPSLGSHFHHHIKSCHECKPCE